MTSHRRTALAVAIVIVAAVAVLVAVLVNGSRPVADGYTGHPASPTPSTTPSTSSTSFPSDPSDRSEPARGDAPTGASPSVAETTPSASEGTAVDHPTWDPATEASEGADTQPKVPDGVGTEPYRLPEVSERRPALTSAPDAAVVEGSLVEGFPQDVIPVPEGATVQSSSVSPQGRRVLVGLHALSDDDPGVLLDVYAVRCADLGWAVTTAPDPDGHERLRCGFRDDSMTVVARRLPTGRVDLTVTGAFLVPEGS